MAIIAVLFAGGILCLFSLPALPGWGYLLAAVGLAIGASAVPRSRRIAPLFAGFAWAQLYTLASLPALLPGAAESGTYALRGQIVSLVDRHAGMARVAVEADRVSVGQRDWQGRWRLRLTWRDAPAVSPGDRVQLTARLRRAHGFASPGAWDYEGWLFHQGIRYVGYVVTDGTEPVLERNEAQCCLLTRFRQRLGETIDALDLRADARGIIRALSVGDRSGLSTSLRDTFSATGTSHLMAISGLHIGLVSGLGFVLARAAWRRATVLAARVPARVAGAGAALCTGACYALLAGMTLPTQRALIMLCVFAFALIRRRQGSLTEVLGLAGTCVLIVDPSAAVSAGFWLSFGAVATIAATHARTVGLPRWRRAVVMQLWISAASWPVLSAFDMPAAAPAPVANIVLVPLFGLLVVPVALLGVALLLPSPVIGSFLLGLLEPVLDDVIAGLTWLGEHSELPMPVAAHDSFSLACVAVALIMLLAPRGVPLRAAAWPLLAVPWLPRHAAVAPGTFELHVLDVGQGLSTVVLTSTHTLVFDTGPAYRSGFAAASSVLVPFLRAHARGRIDRLVLSHGDIDHAGGADRVVAALPTLRIDSGEPDRVDVDARACVAGESWHWDGIDFAYLHPGQGHGYSGNDASCVLQVSTPSDSVLLTGDIERRVEAALVATSAGRLHSDIVVAPHHGSRSSSSRAMVAATSPRFVIYASGWANRYGFPAADVAQRWRSAGAVAINTASAGTVSFLLGDADAPLTPRCHRIHAHRFWWHDGGSAEGCHAVSSRGWRSRPEAE
ncbi:MAG: DNA internalization-related competence protein ComEC/Rec2 [Gammaproteobacteria bacterium]|nr:DNA internalization-related competence protein ComEC/Rec2 [Gammaproteobacteria bacterium]